MLTEYLMIPLYGFIAGLGASIPLGPIGVMCVQRTLSRGRHVGFISGLGAATADTIFAALAVFALTWITSFIEQYDMWVKALGGVLIVFIGFNIYFNKPKRPTAAKSVGAGDYFGILGITLSNPAYFFVFVTIFAAMGIGAADYDFVQKILIIFGVLMGACTWWFLLTFGVSKFQKFFTLRRLMWLNKICGGAIVLIGAYAVLLVVYDLISLLIKSGAIK
ncbi:MAG: LysE family transporter [Rikenellaceae bacterium]